MTESEDRDGETEGVVDVVEEKLRLEMNESVKVNSPRRCWRIRSSAENSSVVLIMMNTVFVERERERELN